MKSVNGVEPDDSGNVTIETGGAGFRNLRLTVPPGDLEEGVAWKVRLTLSASPDFSSPIVRDGGTAAGEFYLCPGGSVVDLHSLEGGEIPSGYHRKVLFVLVDQIPGVSAQTRYFYRADWLVGETSGADPEGGVI